MVWYPLKQIFFDPQAVPNFPVSVRLIFQLVKFYSQLKFQLLVIVLLIEFSSYILKILFI